MPDSYEYGFIGRTTIEVMGMDSRKEVIIPAGSIVTVVDKEEITIGGNPTIVYHTIVLFDDHRVSYDGCHFGMLEPEPGVPNFSLEDHAAAARQGWNVFQVDEPNHPPFEIQLITGSEEDISKPGDLLIQDRFANDEDAWRFVWAGAVEHNDPVAIRALTFLLARSKEEYEAIRLHCLSHPHIT